MSKFAYEKGHAKVEGHSNLIREESSSAIINNDIEGYQAAIRRKRVFQLQREEINTLKDEMGEITIDTGLRDDEVEALYAQWIELFPNGEMGEGGLIYTGVPS